MRQSNIQVSTWFRSLTIIIITLLLVGCNKQDRSYIHFAGKALGSEYHISVKAPDSILLKISIDSIFNAIEQSMSLKIEESTLNKYNQADTTFCYNKINDPHFEPIFKKAKINYRNSLGAFNPAVEPLIQYYGFSGDEIKPIKKEDTSIINELLKLVVFDSIYLTDNGDNTICISKPKKGFMLNFDAIYPGFAIDILSTYLENKGFRNFMISLGSEYRAMGNNKQQQAWTIDIVRPEPFNASKETILPLQISNKAMATNGNYQKMYESNGQKYSHIISPFSGFSHPTNLLSVTVIADDCTTADAFATAFMVLGLEKSLELIEQLKGVDACFIYDNESDGIFEYAVSPGFSKYYLNNEQK